MNAGSMYSADYILDWDIPKAADFIEITSGSVKVIKNDAEYELSFSGTDIQGNEISGYYKGSMKYINYSGGKKSAKLRHIW
jgi:hypothetical protein